MNELNPLRISIASLTIFGLVFVLNLKRESIKEKIEAEKNVKILKEMEKKKNIIAQKKLAAARNLSRVPASENISHPATPPVDETISETASETENGSKSQAQNGSTTFKGVETPRQKNNQKDQKALSKKAPSSNPQRAATAASTVKRAIAPRIGAGIFQKKTDSPTVGPFDSMNSSSPELTISNNTPDGSYLSHPLITLTSSGGGLIKYCVGNSASAFCCDPDSAGVSYSGPFQLGTTDGNYCLSAKSYISGMTSPRRSWNYTVDASLVSLNLTLPQKRFFQTQQLFESMVVNSTELGDSSLTFLQRIMTTDPGSTACETLAASNSLDDMNTEHGFVVNFGAVTTPFQVPLLMSNKLNYGMNYLVSMVERLGSSRSPASATNEYVCLQNAIEVKDFHLEGVSASRGQAFPTDGTYGFQGQLNTLESGKALGANGTTLESGIINIIN